MPGGNGTGPLGMGPRTGRGAGYCTGNSAPGYMNAIGRCFGGWGRGGQGGGRGRGWGFFGPNAYPSAGMADDNARISMLEQQAKNLENSLESILREISQLKGRKETD